MIAAVISRPPTRVMAALLFLLAAATPVPAQDWPTKTVHIVVPFGPGSTPDIVARLVADGLQQKYPASTFVVEDKPGASGNIGTDVVAKAAPDGSTLGVSIGGRLGVIYSPDGLNDTQHTKGCCCCGGNEIANSMEVNVNILVYALTH